MAKRKIPTRQHRGIHKRWWMGQHRWIQNKLDATNKVNRYEDKEDIPFLPDE